RRDRPDGRGRLVREPRRAKRLRQEHASACACRAAHPGQWRGECGRHSYERPPGACRLYAATRFTSAVEARAWERSTRRGDSGASAPGGAAARARVVRAVWADGIRESVAFAAEWGDASASRVAANLPLAAR